MRKINLFQETVEFLVYLGKTPKDVKFVFNGGNNTYNTWEWFEKNANFEYDNFPKPKAGMGVTLNSQLKIVGDNWWLERFEYEGSEYWTIMRLPSIEGKLKAPLKLKEEWWPNGKDM
jgi:hypothetical protein